MNKMKNRGVSHIFQLNPADLIIDKLVKNHIQA